MDLSKILAISGKPGLYQVVSQMKNAVLVESLIDKKRVPAFAHEKISSLQEISIFTTGEDRPLKDIFKAMYEKLEGKAATDIKSDNKALVAFFGEVVPDFDRERVYSSDIKKMVNWYNLLIENNLLDFTETEEEGGEGDEEKVQEAKEVIDVKKKSAPHMDMPKQSKSSTQKVVKKSDHRSMNSK